MFLSLKDCVKLYNVYIPNFIAMPFVLLQPFLFSKILLLAPLYYWSDKRLLALLIQIDTL